MVLLTLHHSNIRVCFETLGALLDTNFIKILNKFYSSNEYGIAKLLFWKRGEGHSKHWGSEEEDWTWKHIHYQSKCKSRKAWNSIWVFSLQNICILSIVNFICCLQLFSSGILYFWHLYHLGIPLQLRCTLSLYIFRSGITYTDVDPGMHSSKVFLWNLGRNLQYSITIVLCVSAKLISHG